MRQLTIIMDYCYVVITTIFFDQGYISFDELGYILLSEEMLLRDHLASYVLRKNYQLPACFLTRERLQFLEYHRKNIFKNMK